MKSLLKALGFFLFCLISYYGISYFLFSETIGRKIPHVSQVQSHLDFWNDSDVYDWVILGSSHAYRGIDPKFFEGRGLKVFNLGSSSQTPMNSLEILKKLPGKAKGVILEVYPVTFNLSGRESFYDLLANSYSLQILWPQWKHLQDARSLQLLLSKPVIDARHREEVPKEKSYKGYVTTAETAPLDTQYTNYKLDNKENLEMQWRSMQQILEFTKDKKIELRLVMAPLPKALVIEGELEFKEQLKSMLQKYSVSLEDDSRNHPLDDHQDFFDSDHLNKNGVSWWMRSMANYF